jgi:hypothetical protein
MATARLLDRWCLLALLWECARAAADSAAVAGVSAAAPLAAAATSSLVINIMLKYKMHMQHMLSRLFDTCTMVLNVPGGVGRVVSARLHGN